MKTNNVHIFTKEMAETKVLLISDCHWDNPHCDRDLLAKHLGEAVKHGHDILINGDLFCLMQGKYDGRRNKSDIRPEHNGSRYLDLVINTAVEWFKPYAKNIKVIGYGNHETSILRHCETDVIERFVTLLNAATGSDIQVGGYGGWVVWHFKSSGIFRVAYKMKYYHGSGGGGPVTKGAISFNRMSTAVEGANAIWMGHVHESTELTYTVEKVDNRNNVILCDVLMVRTPSYKEEYNGGAGGWHVERGAPPKPLGGRWLVLKPHRNKDDATITAYTYKTN
jgi:hypothetical protein